MLRRCRFGGGVERSQVNTALVARVGKAQVEKAPAVRKEHRLGMRCLSRRIHGGEDRRGSSVRRHLPQAFALQAKNDDAVAAPGASSVRRALQIGERLRRAAGYVNFFQSAFRGISDKSAIWRPEEGSRTDISGIGAGKGPR